MTKQQAVVFVSERLRETQLSEVSAYWMATGELPPELVTGHKAIDAEHRFLISAIVNLRQVCIDLTGLQNCLSCSVDRSKQCEGQLISALGDVFAFVLEHFKTEESVMRDSMQLMVDRDVFQAHMEDHAAIAAKVQEIVLSLDASHTVLRIRELDALLTNWIEHHIGLHHRLLTRAIGREGD